MDETRPPTKHTRRTALRSWLTGSASLTLLALAAGIPLRSTLAAPAEQSAGPAPAQVPAAKPTTPTGSAPAPSSATGPAAPAASAPATGAGMTATTPPMCVLTREQTEGPYYIDVELLRSDITEGKDGLPLQLTLTTLNATSCQPLANATVEIWHCDAAGDYSGFSGSLPGTPGGGAGGPGGPPPGGPGGPPPGGMGGPPPGGVPAGTGPAMRNTPTNDMVFLRGGQVSDASGAVTFQTIYPGWYRGRTVHIHLKSPRRRARGPHEPVVLRRRDLGQGV